LAVTHGSPTARAVAPGSNLRGDLQVGLDFPLPRTVAVGAGTALFVCGWCFSAESRLRSLAFEVDGDVQPVMLHGMPRIDVLRAFHPGLHETSLPDKDPDSADDPSLRSYRSGFWGIARIPPRDGEGDCELLLRAVLDDGGEERAELARIQTIRRLGRPVDAQPLTSTGALVAICMATYEPAIEMFRRQIESIRAQTHRNWICLISDDCSSPERVAAMEQVVAGDSRFIITRSPRRLRFYHNFERALSLSPASADFVAMADQDDYWYPDKLEILLREIGSAQLVYSDARIVRTDGELVADTYWSVRRNNHSDMSSLLMANCVTGAASLFRRDLLDLALPFPPGQFTHFHDHWVALTALALGDIAFVDRPLYDYVQHGEAVLGHAGANQITALRERVDSLRTLHRNPRARVGRWRMRFFVDCCRLMQFTTILQMRCGSRLPAAKRRSLARFMKAERSPLALWDLARRSAREMVGPPETVGAELGLLLAFAWRHLLVASIRGRERPRSRLRIDARPPPSLLPTPGRQEPATPAVAQIAAKIAPLELTVLDDAPSRINILIPTIDLDHFFGGYIAKLNLARRLADYGARVRIVTVDPVGPLLPAWRQTLEAYSGLGGLFDRVEVVFGRESAGVEVSPSDRFIATTWWTAHIAREAIGSLGGERFLYLIQEYEPFTFPMGTYAALASESYRFPHFALFSTELLRDYFRRHRIGVYSGGPARGDEESVAFQNAITAVAAPVADELARRSTRRLLFYARPEPHASRNMFELGMLALDRVAQEGTFGQGWELHGIGTVNGQRRMNLGSGALLTLLPRYAQTAYAEVLREHDVGLALMYTAHPSLVPIEMASAGMLTVTNTFENKTSEAMSVISSNVIAVEPSLDGVSAGLREAVARVGDFEGRVRGSDIRWSRNWSESFGDELMARVMSFLKVEG
jgi:beta-1,2-rhamnosyltransferase WsaF-like protein/glycosyl transferase family 2